MSYQNSNEARQAILEAGRRLYQRGYVAANDGNISARMADGTIWATPTGVSKGFMTPEMLVRLTPEGAVVEGTWRVSSEIAMHLAIYRENPALGGVHSMPRPRRPMPRWASPLIWPFRSRRRCSSA